MKKITMTVFLVIFVMMVCIVFSYAQEEEILLGNTFTNLVNEYWVMWNEGAKNAAEGLGCKYLCLSANDSETKQVSDLEIAIAGGVDAIVIQPVTTDTLGVILDLCEEYKVLAITTWDKPKSLNPRDYKYWVAHITIDDVRQGYIMAKVLFEALGGKGKIVAIGGKPGDRGSRDRQDGLKKALKEYPGIQLLAYQEAGWIRFKAISVMEDFVSAFGDKIDGVWSGNDDMAMGAIEVLKPMGLAGGKIKIVGIDGIKGAAMAIKEGDMYATAAGDAWYMCGLATVYAYNAVKGNILPEEKQIFVLEPTIIDQSNVEEFYQANYVEEKSADWKKISEEVAKRIVEVSK